MPSSARRARTRRPMRALMCSPAARGKMKSCHLLWNGGWWMTRSEIESFVRELYQSRLSNDVEKCLGHFTQSSSFRIAGSTETSSIARVARSIPSIRKQIEELIRVWQWRAVDQRALIIDGYQVAVHYSVTATFTPSGQTVTTEVVDLLTVEDSKVVTFTQFIDTAALAQLGFEQ
jgi:ketosteroid isomerase-like protein